MGSPLRLTTSPLAPRPELWRRGLGPLLGAWALGLLLLTGCGEDEPPPPPLSEEELHALRVQEAKERARRWLRDAFEEHFLVWEQEEAGLEPPLRRLLTLEDPPLRLRRKLFLAYVYAGRGWQPVLVREQALSALGEAVVARLRAAGDHALDVSRYWDDAIAGRVEELAAWRAMAASLPDVQPTSAERRALARHMVELDLEDPKAWFNATVHAAFVEEPAPVWASELEELRTLWRTRRALLLEVQAAEAVVEAALMDRLLHYAFDQRHGNVAMFGGDVSEQQRLAIIADRLLGLVGSLGAAETPEDIAALLATLQPPHPQVPLLLRERARYAAIVDAGGWERIATFQATFGTRHPRIAALKERLQIEGYYEGELDDRFDESLRAAIRWYQRTHQLDETGALSPPFWASLNVPADQRLQQIDLTLQRWRESRIGDDTYYVFVNIPDFHAEVWRDGVREMRFRVVVGNNRRECDRRTGRWVLPNATPLRSFRMSYVVLNPFWNIPRRLVENLLLPELARNPNYFEQQGYERFINEAGQEMVRQRPGPTNALGMVKFMFPNDHNVYMHDTPQRQYFRNPIRAFSSGCVRVEQPLAFLRYLLEKDGQWDEARIQRLFDRGEEVSVTFRRSIPVHFEYYVVRVDDDGMANFLADIYRFDRNRMAPPDDRELVCTPPPQPTLRLVLDADGRAVYRDEQGNLIPPDRVTQRGGQLRVRPATDEDGQGSPPGDVGP